MTDDEIRNTSDSILASLKRRWIHHECDDLQDEIQIMIEIIRLGQDSQFINLGAIGYLGLCDLLLEPSEESIHAAILSRIAFIGGALEDFDTSNVYLVTH